MDDNLVKDLQMTPEFVVDENGKKTGVYLSIEDFNKIMELLEDFADIIDYDEAMKEPGDAIPFEQFVRELEAEDRVKNTGSDER
ncbi:MAG: hypothetical protein IT368_07955 [Candidatus Hydrogenedentes bacterium]|nr:hypothetical protein [Candidatus Hydrogenedentota bacterium]